MFSVCDILDELPHVSLSLAGVERERGTKCSTYRGDFGGIKPVFREVKVGADGVPKDRYAPRESASAQLFLVRHLRLRVYSLGTQETVSPGSTLWGPKRRLVLGLLPGDTRDG